MAQAALVAHRLQALQPLVILALLVEHQLLRHSVHMGVEVESVHKFPIPAAVAVVVLEVLGKPETQPGFMEDRRLLPPVFP